MKSLVISLVIAITIVGASILYQAHLNSVSKELISKNDKIEESIKKGDYIAAKNLTDESMAYLEKQRTILAATDNHEVLDKIEMNLNELYEYIKGSQETDAMSKCSVLRFLYEHLPKNYELKLENIL